MATKPWLTAVLMLCYVNSISPAKLHEKCEKSSDCSSGLSHCNESAKECVCLEHSVKYNKTCLPGTLLGFECQTDAQCGMKVLNSGCVNGVCTCSMGFTAYRRHSCLPPAKFGEICFTYDQCALADPGTTCKFLVPRVFGRCQCQPGMGMDTLRRKCAMRKTKVGHPCKMDSDCRGIQNAFCQQTPEGSSVCTCEAAFSPSGDGNRCLPTYRGLLLPTSLGYPCQSNLQCQLVDPNSVCREGICDCSLSNASCNGKNTGCHPSTFQCRGDGTCVSYYFQCDGVKQCSDGSDEICEGVETCPKQAFQCKPKTPRNETKGGRNERMDIKCISRSKLCNGVYDCEGGEDEEGCMGNESCPRGTFQCTQTKECLPEHHFCNSIPDCRDHSDEDERVCRLEFHPAQFCPFRCANGLCRSSAIICSGVNGCGDLSDEKPCSVCRCPRE